MFETDKQKTLAQMSAQILAGMLANPSFFVEGEDIQWDALCADADQAARHLFERASG